MSGRAEMSQKIVLIVEDEEDIRETLRLSLELEGYAVQTAENGKTALELLQNGPLPCIILLDLMMPQMNGWQFTENVRKDENLKLIPIVVVTAFNERTRPIDVQKVMKKPVDLNDLINMIEKYCP
jgi:CheY-like chemotaxis protein